MATTRTLPEDESKRVLATYGVPFAPETVAEDVAAAVAAADDLGYPVVAKLNGEGIAHKTERGLVRLNLADAEAVEVAATELLRRRPPRGRHGDRPRRPVPEGQPRADRRHPP